MKSVIKTGFKILTTQEKADGHGPKPTGPTQTVDIGKFPVLNMTPPQTLDALGTAGQHKAHRTWDQTLILSINAGMFIGFGGLFALNAATNSTGFVTYGFAGVQKILFALCFCAGLYLVVFTGADMFTGNIGSLFIALYQRKINFVAFLMNFFVSWVGNFIGGFAFAYFFAYVTFPGQRDNPTEPWVNAVKLMGKHKVHHEWNVLLMKAIGCNWAVSLAFFCATAAKDVPGKVILLALPIAGFFAAGYEHSVANMFIIPLAWLYNAPDVSMYSYAYNISLVTLGNVIGSVLMYATVLLYAFDLREKLKEAESHFFALILFLFSGGKLGKIPFKIQIADNKAEEKKKENYETPKAPETAKNQNHDEESKIETKNDQLPSSNPLETVVELKTTDIPKQI